jgi:hypothetical protein
VSAGCKCDCDLNSLTSALSEQELYKLVVCEGVLAVGFALKLRTGMRMPCTFALMLTQLEVN